jgi:hypothetical protein
LKQSLITNSYHSPTFMYDIPQCIEKVSLSSFKVNNSESLQTEEVNLVTTKELPK